MTRIAFFPTNDWWFWVGNEPTWTLSDPPDSQTRLAFSKEIVWEGTAGSLELGVCADGLIFLDHPADDRGAFAEHLYQLNALNLLFVAALRKEIKIDAGLDWISRLSCVRGYQPESGLGGSGTTFSRNWAGIMGRMGLGSLPLDAMMVRRQIGLDLIESWMAMADHTLWSPVRVRLLAEYSLAISLFHDHNFAGALTHAWFVSEHLFSAKWQGLFPENKPRTPAGKKLKDLEEHLDLFLFADLDDVKEVRNDLAHAIGEAGIVSSEDANRSFFVADKLIELEWGICLGLGGRGLSF